MSPFKRIACATAVSIALHLFILASVSGYEFASRGAVKLPGLLFVHLVELGGRGAEASIGGPDAPFMLHSQGPESRTDPEVPPAMDEDCYKGEHGKAGDGKDLLDRRADESPRSLSLSASEQREEESTSFASASEEAGPSGKRGGPRCISCPAPAYPDFAEERAIEGKVVVRFQVLADGTVGDIFVEQSSGFPLLDETALAAVKSWKFAPAEEDAETRVSTRKEVFQFFLESP